MRTKQASLAIAALLAGAAAAWLAADRTFEPYQTAPAPLALLVGWSFIGSGLAACRVRPDSPLGKVMVLTGFAWFASFLTDADQSLLFTIGTAVQSVYLVGFVYLVVTFPSGRLRGRCLFRGQRGADECRETLSRERGADHGLACRSLLTVTVEDNGIGGAVLVGGSGLRGLTDRVEALSGRLTVSSPPGRGTSLRAEIPCE